MPGNITYPFVFVINVNSPRKRFVPAAEGLNDMLATEVSRGVISVS